MPSHLTARHTGVWFALTAQVALLLGGLISSPLFATDLCDQCCENSQDPELWCSTCQRTCKEKTTKKWVYWCREKLYCQPCTPRLFSSEECLECECTPRKKRVMLKKQVKETHSHLTCELIKPEKPKPAKSADVPPAPAADKDQPKKDKDQEGKGTKSPKTAKSRRPSVEAAEEYVPPPLDTESATAPVRSLVK
jgi:hypothetical protein